MKNIDLHCDLLSYYLHSNLDLKDDIGCSLPYLLEGDVVLQIMAIYSSTEKASTQYAQRQIEVYKNFLSENKIYQVNHSNINQLEQGKIGTLISIENASGLCEEEDSLDICFKNFDRIINEIGYILYIGLTHHTENRFGGGNTSTKGLTEDGKALVDYLNGKQIAIDLSHTSDNLAFDLLNYIDKKNYDIRLLASHSNARSVHNHPRNLPDELILELIKRKGLIGLNFVKYFINPENPNELFKHIEHILNLGGENNLCYGGDFFFDKAHPDQSRYPYFFEEYKNALCYNSINKKLNENFSLELMEKVSHLNALNFIKTSLQN